MSDQYIGEIRYFACSFAPQGWATCDGSMLSIAENQALFVLIGTAYGGNGTTTFGLPDLRGRVPIGVGPINQIGAATGTETVTLTTGQMPPHNHQMVASTDTANATAPGGLVYAANEENAIYTVPSSSSPGTMVMNNAMIGVTGQSMPHDNIAPTLALRICIATTGIFPSRP